VREVTGKHFLHTLIYKIAGFSVYDKIFELSRVFVKNILLLGYDIFR